MVCRNQVRIAVQLATLAILIVGAAAGYLLLRAERLVAARVIAGIEESVPHWDINVDDVRLDGAQARIFGLRIAPKGESEPIVIVPEVVVSLDPDSLAMNESIIPQHLELRQPIIRVRRYDDGSMNIDRLKPWPKSNGQTILTEIDRATLSIEQRGGKAELRDIDLQLVPKSQGRFALSGAGRLDEFGDVQIVGDADIGRRIFDFTVRGRVDIDDELVSVCADWNPAVADKLASLSKSNIKVAAAGPDELLNGVAGPATLGLVAEADMVIHLKQSGDAPPDWSVTTDIVRGQLDNPLFPLPLRDLTGRVTVGNDGVTVEKLSAANGSSGFTVAGSAQMLGGGVTQKTFEIRATDVSLDGPLRDYLTPGLATVHKLINPQGRVDIVARIDESGAAVNRWNLVALEVRDGAFSCSQFPYPVTAVRGRARQVGPDVHLDFTGKAGTRDVTITGRVISAGAGAGFDILIATDGVPIEAQLKNAFRTPALKSVGVAAEALNLTGSVDGMVQLTRPPNVPAGTRPLFRVDLKVRDGSLKYNDFPYRLEDAEGTIRYDDADDAIWHFEKLSAQKGSARVTADGVFKPPAGRHPGQLDMTFQADSVPFDREFSNAICSRVAGLREVFAEVNPTGQLFGRDIHLLWSPNQEPTVDLPEVIVRDGSVRLASFPYTWTDVETKFRIEERVRIQDDQVIRRVVFEELSARHNSALLRLRTNRLGDNTVDENMQSFGEAFPDGWQVRLYGLEVRDWVIDQPLIEAFPEDLNLTLTSLNIQRPVNVDGDLIVSSVPKDPLRIAARGQVELPGNDMFAGVDLKGVRGTVQVNPVIVSNEGVELRGRIDFQQAQALNMSFTDIAGPVKFFAGERAKKNPNGEMTLGSQAMVGSRPVNAGTVSASDRLTASLYGGRAGIDVFATIRDDGEIAYDLAATVADADLYQWSVDNDLSSLELYGKMNGEVRLSGLSNDVRTLRGENGYLMINQARIFKLPAIAQMTSVLNMRQPDDTAFRLVDMSFDVRDGYFDFDKIQLQGNNLSFLGKGQAYFRPEDYGEIDFNFGSYVTPNNSSIISKMWAGLGDGWVYGKLSGSIGNPVFDFKGRVPLFDNLGGAMRSIESGQYLNPRGTRRTTR